jgi:glycerol-3-phosphate dehydrogenase subunit C
MAGDSEGRREGSLEAPTRHPLGWQEAEFYDEDALFSELERVYDICHGCRRCVSLCHAFPTLFDLVDKSDTMEVNGVAKEDYWKVVDHCYLCDLCYMTKCPYVPPHEWNVDFPHLMLRAKANRFKQGKVGFRDKLLSNTDLVGQIAGIPVVSQTVNALNRSGPARKLLDKTLGVHPHAKLPVYHSKTLKKRVPKQSVGMRPQAAGETSGKVALFATCYGNRNEPDLGQDLVAVFEHNKIVMRLVQDDVCCGMPKLELGDLDGVAKLKERNIPKLHELVEQGWDIVAPIPSCVLMFKQELPLMYPDDPAVAAVAQAIYDPFEYLMLRHRAGALDIEFKRPLGRVAYHSACHQRVQNIGPKTKEIFNLIPGTEVTVIERCSGHDGTYAIKSRFHEISMKLVRPVSRRVRESEVDHYFSDCPMAAQHIENGLDDAQTPENPFALLCYAYGIGTA